MTHFLLFIIIILTVLSTLVNSKFITFQNNSSGRIINGHDVPLGKYPFVVSLQLSEKPCDPSIMHQGRHFCGGAVINDNTILTAAHCPAGFDTTKMHVLISGVHLDQMGGCYKVTKYVQHPSYNGNVGQTPDVAVIKLASSIDFEKNKQVKKICLPRKEENPVSERCTLIGWGKMDGSKPELARHLQEIQVTARKFSGWYQGGDTEMHYKITFEESGGGSCAGDSGGPLFCPVQGDERTTLIFGVSSFIAGGPEECVGEYGYTNIALYDDWIKQVAEE